MSYYVPLPAYNPGSGINFEPLNQGTTAETSLTAFQNIRCSPVQKSHPTTAIPAAGSTPSLKSAGGRPDQAQRILRYALTTMETEAQINASAKMRK